MLRASWVRFGVLVAVALVIWPIIRADAARNEAIVMPLAGPYELVIVEVEGCIYCDVLRRDAMPAFNASPEAKQVSVRFLDLNTAAANALELTEGPLTTVPTVLLVKGNREMSRAAGYMGPDGFLSAIQWMMKNAP
jgi:thioredoxin-related protein